MGGKTAFKWGSEITQKQLSEEDLPGFERCGAIYPDFTKQRDFGRR